MRLREASDWIPSFGIPGAGPRDPVHGQCFLERAQEMVKNKADVLAIDSAHGHSSRVLEAIQLIKSKLPEIDLIACHQRYPAGLGKKVDHPDHLKTRKRRSPKNSI